MVSDTTAEAEIEVEVEEIEGEDGGAAGGAKEPKWLAPLVERCKALTKQWKPGTRALDTIMSGRMLASKASQKQEFGVTAAARFAHLFSTNAAAITDDYFVGSDDLVMASEKAHLGNNQLASSTLYSYVALDLNLAERGLGRDEAAEGLECYLRCLLDGEPSGRQTTMSGHTPSFFTFAVLHGAPMSMAGAFERPVGVHPGSDLSLSEESVVRFGRHWSRIAGLYAGDKGDAFTPEAGALMCMSDREDLLTGLASYAVPSRVEFFGRIRRAIEAGLSRDGAGRIGGRFLDVHRLIFTPGVCYNRDELNQVKTIDVGGVTRIRVSSQCAKYAVRELVLERYTGPKGRRTKRMVSEIMQRLGVQDAVSKLVVSTVVHVTVASVVDLGQGGDVTKQLVSLGSDEIQRLVDLIRGSWDDLAKIAQEIHDQQAGRLEQAFVDDEGAKRAEVKGKAKPRGKRK